MADLENKQVVEQEKDLATLNTANGKILELLRKISPRTDVLKQTSEGAPQITSIVDAPQDTIIPKKTQSPIHIVRYIQNTFPETLMAKQLAFAEKQVTLNDGQLRVMTKKHDPTESTSRVVERAIKNERYYVTMYKTKQALEDLLLKQHKQIDFAQRAVALEEEEAASGIGDKTPTQRAKQLKKLHSTIKDLKHNVIVIEGSLRNFDVLQKPPTA